VTHEIVVEPHWQAHGVWVRCSCSPAALARLGGVGSPALLDELNKLAHDHIEEAERDGSLRSPSPAYRTDSLVTREDELVDLEDALMQARLGDDFT
jgi:hypothetical protein